MCNFIRRFAALLLCVALLSAGASTLAAEKTLDVTYVKITGEGFVADTLNGVPALYNLYGSKYYCTELITRYYAKVYGLNVQPYGGGPTVIGADGYWFTQAETPQPGDILFAPAARRGKSYNHWALVKSYDAETGVMTLIEQNWRWNGCAGVDRKLAFPNDVYTCYTLVSGSGRVATLHEKQIDASWASEAIYAAENAGIFSTDGSYSAPATREQLCQMAVNLVTTVTGEQPLVRELPLDEDGMTDESYCAQAYAMGILSGSTDGKLHHDSPVTRVQAAVILARACALAGLQVQTELDVLTQFVDGDEIGAWATDAVAVMATCGVLQGDGEGNFNPNGTLSVASAVTVAMRAHDVLRVQSDINSLMPSVMTYAAQASTLRTLSSIQI